MWADKVGKTAPHDSPCTAQGVTPLLAGCEEGSDSLTERGPATPHDVLRNPTEQVGTGAERQR